MKITAEIDLNYIGEDESIDDAILSRIVEKITGSVSSKISDEIKNKVFASLQEKVAKTIDDLLSDFMNRPVVQTDKWGDKVSEFSSVSEMLKTNFDEFMTTPVDNNGKPIGKSCGYGSGSRIEMMIQKRVKEKGQDVERLLKDQIDKLFKIEQERILKDAVAKSLVSQVDFNLILGKQS
jgi:hypothetical protein